MLSNNVYELLIFDEENLKKWLCFGSDIFRATKNIDYHILDETELLNKQQYEFLLSYFKDDCDCLNAGYILVEKEYFSKSYISDYQNYYVKYHNAFPRNAVRLHFIKEIDGFDINNIDNLTDLYTKLLNIKEFDDNYLGYIVVKPVPNSTIGATLLKHYSGNCCDSNGEERNDKKRNYWAVRNYKINIFGKQINKFKTMVFMEQDKAVGACSTFALWSGLHVLCNLFDIPILTPSEITNKATLNYSSNSDSYEKGLSASQIILGLSKMELRCHAYSYEKSDYPIESTVIGIKEVFYAYLKCGIPLFALTKPMLENDKDGKHMITINGFRNDKNSKSVNMFKSIDVFYAHDDRLGPFSKYRFKTVSTTSETSKDPNKILLDTKWIDENDKSKNIDFQLSQLLIALPKEIKVNFDDILEVKKKFNTDFDNKYEIVCTLQSSNEYKCDLLDNKDIKENIDNNFIGSKNLPKFIWVMSFYENKIDNNKTETIHIFDLIYDTENPTNKHRPIASQIIYNDFKNDLDEYSFKLMHKNNVDNSFDKIVVKKEVNNLRFKISELKINNKDYALINESVEVQSITLSYKFEIIDYDNTKLYQIDYSDIFINKIDNVLSSFQSEKYIDISMDLENINLNDFDINVNSNLIQFIIFRELEIINDNTSIYINLVHYQRLLGLIYPKYRRDNFLSNMER